MTTPLSDLDLDDLVERLIAIAKEARALAATSNFGGVATLVEEVKAATRVATAERLAVLEVAEAYLRAMPHISMGRVEHALRAFAQEPARLQLLATAASPAGLDPAVASSADRAALDRLVEVGALRALQNGRLDVAPSQRAFVRELLEPLAFRLWARVQAARAAAATQAEQLTVLVEHLGVTTEQASQHLATWPLSPRPQDRPVWAPTPAPKVFVKVFRPQSAGELDVAPMMPAALVDDPRDQPAGASTQRSVGQPEHLH